MRNRALFAAPVLAGALISLIALSFHYRPSDNSMEIAVAFSCGMVDGQNSIMRPLTPSLFKPSDLHKLDATCLGYKAVAARSGFNP
jgi:hypothetical protein